MSKIRTLGEAITHILWCEREILEGRVFANRTDIDVNTDDILKAQADMVEAVIDEYNALIE